MAKRKPLKPAKGFPILTVAALLSALFVTIVVAVVAFCVLSTPNLKDCGTNTQCLQDAINRCMPAKANIVSGGIYVYEEVRGARGDTCEYYVRCDRVDTSSYPAIYNAQANYVIYLMGNLSGKDMTCRMPMANGVVSMNTLTAVNGCSGPLRDALLSVSEYAYTMGYQSNY